LKILIGKTQIELNQLQEECILNYCGYRNFARKNQIFLTKVKNRLIRIGFKYDISDCNLSEFDNYLSEHPDKYEVEREKFGYATVDGARKKLSRFMVDSPGFFISHTSLCGCWKNRINPTDISYNTKNFGYLAKWNITFEDSPHVIVHYVYIANSEACEKYNDAQFIGRHHNILLKQINHDLKSCDYIVREYALYLYFLAFLALKIGKNCQLLNNSVKIDNSLLSFHFVTKNGTTFTCSFKVLNELVLKVVSERLVYDQMFPDIKYNKLLLYVKTILPQIPSISLKSIRLFKLCCLFEELLGQINYDESELLKISLLNETVKNIGLMCVFSEGVGADQSKGKKCFESIVYTTKNFLDPRIVVVWCRKHNIQLNQIFSKSLMKRVQWCLSISDSFKFSDCTTNLSSPIITDSEMINRIGHLKRETPYISWDDFSDNSNE